MKNVGKSTYLIILTKQIGCDIIIYEEERRKNSLFHYLSNFYFCAIL